MKITNTIRAIRKERNISQTGMAKDLNIHKQTLYKIEKGLIVPSVKVALLIGEYLDLKIESFYKIVI